VSLQIGGGDLIRYRPDPTPFSRYGRIPTLFCAGDGHFSNPVLMALCESDDQLDFIFGLAGNKVLLPAAEPLLSKARALHAQRCESARLKSQAEPAATRLYDDVVYQAGSWPKAYRVVLKAEIMALGDNPRFVVTSLVDPAPEALYRDLDCARGQDENFIKAVKNDLASDRTSLPRQPPAPVLCLCRLQPDPQPAREHPVSYRTGEGAADEHHPEAVQVGGAGGAVQGLAQITSTKQLSG
jgi:hypothetical protein